MDYDDGGGVYMKTLFSFCQGECTATVSVWELPTAASKGQATGVVNPTTEKQMKSEEASLGNGRG